MTLTVFCGLGVTSYPQPPLQREHGCTVGIDRDPPVWHLHVGRTMEVQERQLLRACLRLLVLLYTWSYLIVVVLWSHAVCHPQIFVFSRFRGPNQEIGPSSGNQCFEIGPPNLPKGPFPTEKVAQKGAHSEFRVRQRAHGAGHPVGPQNNKSMHESKD